MGDFARERGLKVHIDGARFFNAAVALGCDPATLAAGADSVSFCLSKGLCCPVGSVLVGSRSFIHQARRVRKLLGGGMRQAGILAAAGIYALDHVVPRLAEDHAHAKLLADLLTAPQDSPFELCYDTVHTNMVFFRLRPGSGCDPATLQETLLREGISLAFDPQGGCRAVTHMHVTRSDVERVAHRLHTLVRNPTP